MAGRCQSSVSRFSAPWAKALVMSDLIGLGTARLLEAGDELAPRLLPGAEHDGVDRQQAQPRVRRHLRREVGNSQADQHRKAGAPRTGPIGVACVFSREPVASPAGVSVRSAS